MSKLIPFHGFSGRLLECMQDCSGPGSAGEAAFRTLAVELFALQFGQIAVYRRFCESRGATPETVTDWRQIPAVPAAAFKEFDLSCLPTEERTRVFLSSGTTQERRSSQYHSPDSLRIYEASLEAWFGAHLLANVPASSLRLLVLTPPPQAAPNSSLVHMFQTLGRRSEIAETEWLGRVEPGGGWSVELPAATEALQLTVREKHPVLLLSTAFSLVHLLDDLARSGRRLALPEGSRALETGGYKGRSREVQKKELYALVTDQLGLPPSHIISEYGMSELSSQAYDHVAGTARVVGEASRALGSVFHFPPWARSQIVSPETGCEVADGESGLVRVLDLANVYSVLAVQTEDLGIRRGAGFQLVGRAQLAEPRGCSLMTADL